MPRRTRERDGRADALRVPKQIFVSSKTLASRCTLARLPGSDVLGACWLFQAGTLDRHALAQISMTIVALSTDTSERMVIRSFKGAESSYVAPKLTTTRVAGRIPFDLKSVSKALRCVSRDGCALDDTGRNDRDCAAGRQPSLLSLHMDAARARRLRIVRQPNRNGRIGAGADGRRTAALLSHRRRKPHPLRTQITFRTHSLE